MSYLLNKLTHFVGKNNILSTRETDEGSRILVFVGGQYFSILINEDDVWMELCRVDSPQNLLDKPKRYYYMTDVVEIFRRAVSLHRAFSE